jgi:hypothetical protein
VRVQEARVAIPIEKRLDEVVGLVPRAPLRGTREVAPPAPARPSPEQQRAVEPGRTRSDRSPEAPDRKPAPTQPRTGGPPRFGSGEIEAPLPTLIQTVREEVVDPAPVAAPVDTRAESLHRVSPQPQAAAIRAVGQRVIRRSPKPEAAGKTSREPVANPPVVLSPRVQPALPVMSARQDSRGEARAPDVHITIGSVEIRAQTAPARPGGAPKSRPQRLSVSLADYLQRRGGQRS